MASINLGRVGFVLRGGWTNSATYNPLDVVLYNGTSYAAKTTSTGLAPSAASAAWQELTQISSAVASGIAASAVRYDTAQSLTGGEQETARSNIGAGSASQVSTLNTRVGTAETDITVLQSDVGDLQEASTAHGDAIDTLTGDVGELQEASTAHGDAIDTLTGDVGELQEASTAHGDAIDTLTGDVGDLQEASTTHGQAIDTLTGDVGELETDVGNLKTNAVQYKGVLDTTTVTPENVTEIGYWVAAASTTLALIGVGKTSVFFNLRRPPNNDFLQMFVTSNGEVYCRNSKGIDFASQSDLIRGVLANPNETTAPGFYGATAAVTNQYTNAGVTVTCPFLNVTTESGTVYYQAFFLPGGMIYSRYGNSGDFSSVTGQHVEAINTLTIDMNSLKSNAVQYRGVLTTPTDTPTVTPDTVTEIGYWVATNAVTNALIGINSASVFFNLKNPPYDFQQMFVTAHGEIYCRYNRNGSFVSQSDFVRGMLSLPTYEGENPVTPDTVTGPGFYGSPAATTEYYTDSRVQCPFLNVTSDSGTVYFQAFFLPRGVIYTRNGNTGDFISLTIPRRQTVFIPNRPITIGTNSNGFLTATIHAGSYLVPEYYLGINTISEDITITQTNVAVYEYGVFNLTSKTGRLVQRGETLATDDLALFVMLGSEVINISVADAKFPNAKQSLKTINDFFAPMFNRTGAAFKIVLGGDSITWGAGGTGAEANGDVIISFPSGDIRRNPNGYCWANLFKSYIEANYNATVTNNGISSSHSQNWDYYKSQLIPNDTDLFILTIGTNNRYKREVTGLTHDDQLNNYYTQMKSIIEYCKGLGIPILLCSSIPASAANEDAVDAGGDAICLSHVYEYNGILQKLSAEYNMEYFNLYDAMYYYCMDKEIALTDLLHDGLHPNDRGYRVMYYLYLKGFNLAPSYVPVELPQT